MPGHTLAPAVEKVVRRTAVEADGRAVRVNRREVGDAAEIEHGSRGAGPCEDRPMKRRNERRTLATRGDVAAAKVGDHVDACQLGEQRRRAELHRVADAVEFAGAMPDRLAVAADRDDPGGFGSRLADQRSDDLGARARQGVGGESDAVHFIGRRTIEREQLLAQRRGECTVRVGERVR